MKHYHVSHGIPGYSRDESYAVRTQAEAISALVTDAKNYRESEWDLPHAQRRTGSGNAKDDYIKFERPNDPYDLGYVYEWTGPCYDPDCDDVED